METTNDNTLQKIFFVHPIFSHYDHGYTMWSLKCGDHGMLAEMVVGDENADITSQPFSHAEFDAKHISALGVMLRTVQKCLYTDMLEWNPDEMITPASLKSAIFTSDGLVISRRDAGKWSTPRIELSMRKGCEDLIFPSKADLLLNIFFEEGETKPAIKMPACLITGAVVATTELGELFGDYTDYVLAKNETAAK